MGMREDRLRDHGETLRRAGATHIEGHVQPCLLDFCRRAACDNDSAAGRARLVGVKRRRRLARHIRRCHGTAA